MTHMNRMNPEEKFTSITQHFLSQPGVTLAKMFGAPTLKTGSKVFACLYKGKLVLKLPKARVDALAASGQGEAFDPGMGRVMKEWVALDPVGEAQMRALCEEARAFVSGGK